MTTSNLIIRSSVARVSFTVVAMAISFFMMPFIIRHLGDRWYGILTMLSAITGYYYLIDFGLASAVTRFVTMYIARDDHENTNIVINTSLAIYCIMAILIFLATIGVSYFAYYFVTESGDLAIVRLAIIIMGINLALEFPFKAFAGIMGAYVRYDLLTYSHFLALIFSTALTVYFLLLGYGIIALATIGLLTSIMSNIIFYLVAKYLYKSMRLSKRYFKKSQIRELFSYSVWAFVMQIGEQMRYRIDSFVIAWYLSAAAVTHYSVGANFPLAVISLIYRATNFLVPVFTRDYAEGNIREIQERLLFATKINAILATFGGGLLIIIGKPLIIRWIGDEYLDAYPVLVILTVGIIIESIQNPSNNVLMAISRHRYFACVNLAEGVGKLLLSIALVQSYGIVGVGYGTVIPLLISRMIVMPHYVASSLGMSLWKYYTQVLNIVGGTVIYLLVVAFLSEKYLSTPEYSRLVTLSLITLPFYLVTTIFFFTKTEREIIFQLLPVKICKQRQ